MVKAFNKSRLVQAIVKDYIAKNTPNWEVLKTAFPDNIQGAKGVIAKKDAGVKERDFYMDAPFTLSDGTHVVTCRQWGADNIANFIAQAKTLGYAITSQAKAKVEEVKEAPAAKPKTLKEININITGSITNYMFGLLEDEAYGECKKAMSFAIDDDIETMEEFVKMYYETTLNGGDGMEIFKESIDMEKFNSNCPLLSSFLAKVEEGDAGHLQFYEDILDMNLRDEVNFIEDDAAITITVDGKEIVPQQKLIDFLGDIEHYVEEEDDPKAVAMVKAFWDKNGAKFNMEDRDEHTINKAENGVLLLPEWIEPTGLAHYNTRERNITAEHDNIVDFDFYFKAADFDLSKLAFFGFANTDFHHSFPDYVGSYLAYDNKIIRPDQNIHRDKGFILHYEDNAKSYNYLIEG
jgi:hypothetical protein